MHKHRGVAKTSGWCPCCLVAHPNSLSLTIAAHAHNATEGLTAQAGWRCIAVLSSDPEALGLPRQAQPVSRSVSRTVSRSGCGKDHFNSPKILLKHTCSCLHMMATACLLSGHHLGSSRILAPPALLLPLWQPSTQP